MTVAVGLDVDVYVGFIVAGTMVGIVVAGNRTD